ncbi:hypothetical protein AHF37_11981 [Paragonimus kellicotti]|nr:hypothetical protein AHF37_11981 [Paragonimus kellicotti]
MAREVSVHGLLVEATCYYKGRPEPNLFDTGKIDRLQSLTAPLNMVCNMSNAADNEPAIFGQVNVKFTDVLCQERAAVYHDDLECCTTTKVSLFLCRNTGLIVLPKHPVPYAAILVVDNALVRLQESGLLQPVNSLT